MTAFTPPLEDMAFCLNSLGLLDRVREIEGCAEITAELVAQVLDEAGRFSADVLAPLNRSGDRQGAACENGAVRAPDGFADAYRQFVDAGWNGLPFSPAHGGQGLPWLVESAVFEMMTAANTAWALCPMLTIGAVELLEAHGTPAQQATYLPKLVSGAWTGTMNLTEPQAGSDVGALRTRAVPDGDRYRLHGQKIFITWGEHDMADNIVHLVLARTPDAPEGTRGISLFLVPKYLVGAGGTPGARNDLRCGSIEHKLGINASPTCVMLFGENEGAVGYLVGEENRGLTAMFTMMNNARLNVGISGLAIAERAYQQARDYARERIQGSDRDNRPTAIVHHADVRRMLMTMKAQIEAMRAFVYDAALGLDVARRHPDGEARARMQARVDLLTPVVKAWCTDLGVEIASLGVQVHGGMGYVEETGAAQHFRDSRIAPIYEGTNGIQAHDLVVRKVLRDGGAAAASYIEEIQDTVDALAELPGDDVAAIGRALADAAGVLVDATRWLVEEGTKTPDKALAGASPYLRLFGTVAGGMMMGRRAIAATRGLGDDGGRAAFYEAKLLTSRFYAENVLPQAGALLPAIREGHRAILAFAEEQF